jgi:hypothetical protein
MAGLPTEPEQGQNIVLTPIPGLAEAREQGERPKLEPGRSPPKA